MTLDPKIFEDIAKRLAEAIPAGARDWQVDIERNMRTILSSGLDKLHLVTREEFEAQSVVLARTRSKLDALAERLTLLEAEKPTNSD